VTLPGGGEAVDPADLADGAAEAPDGVDRADGDADLAAGQADLAADETDLAVVSGQLGRQARDVTGIAVRCPFGRPAIIETSPVLTGGLPNPTLLYLTCPSAVAVISRIESAGGVRHLKSAWRTDLDLRARLDEVTRAYQERRAFLAEGADPRPEAGIGGPEDPGKASCLHAYAAALLAVRGGWLVAGAPGLAGGPAERPEPPAEAAWDRVLPARDALWCTDDRCECWAVEARHADDRRAHPATGRCEEGQNGASRGSGKRVAAIDVGTISVRLLVADVIEGRPQNVLRKVEVTRLGEGLRPGGFLEDTAVRRTAAVARRYAQEARRFGASEIILAGTSAARDAADGGQFIAALGDETKVTAIVLSGDQEARLAYAGASLDVEGDFVVLDVGGGSTELICGVPGGGVEAVSLDMGASRATERWLRADPPRAGEMVEVREEAADLLRPLRPRFGAGVLRGSGTDHGPAPTKLVGVAGTVTTLACLDAGLDVYDSGLIHLRRLSRDAVVELVTRLGGMTVAERADLPCVQAGRAAVIVGGALIVQTAMEILGYAELIVSERDLLDGLVLCGPS
jgi:exopolyphosphatase/guanosine-5'-triphosphate,3'-diphosphate pyrophosphatase